MSRRPIERLALVGPVPPIRSGVADFFSMLLPAFAERAEVSLLVDAVRPNAEVRRSGVAEIAKLGSRAAERLVDRADAVLIQLGNDPLHKNAYELLLALQRQGRPAIAELHDVVLGHFAAALWVTRRDERRYLEEARIGHGERGERIARIEVLTRGRDLWNSDPWRLPMSGRAVRAAAGIVVHSGFARRKVWGVRPEVPAAVIPLAAVPAHAFPSRQEARARLGLAPVCFVVSSTGFVVPPKRLDTVLEALSAFRERESWCFRIVGHEGQSTQLRERSQALGIADRVVFTGFVSSSTLRDEIVAADLLVNLRDPTLGEASASVATILSAGLPVVVSDTGWYAELPDDVVFKVPTGSETKDALARLLDEVWAEPERRGAVGRAAAEFARQEWAIPRVVERYLAELPRLAAGPTASDELQAQIALAAVSLGDREVRIAPGLAAGLEFAIGPSPTAASGNGSGSLAVRKSRPLDFLE